MNLRLVVAGGVHEGKAIPINAPQFVIGRDPQCQLRPNSTAISKRHCAVLIRGDRAFVRDFGSTNGTFVNDALLQGEVEIHDGDRLKVGPLDFRVALEVTAVTAAPKPVAAAAKGAGTDADAVDVATKPESTSGPGSDKMAEMLLLGDDDKGSSEAANQTHDHAAVADGSTVVELPAVGKPGDKTPKPKSVTGTGNTSQAAADILSKYSRRPRSS
jgi:pSer/pThr/pTyr-binding forkhead associated (FHA) protein